MRQEKKTLTQIAQIAADSKAVFICVHLRNLRRKRVFSLATAGHG